MPDVPIEIVAVLLMASLTAVGFIIRHLHHQNLEDHARLAKSIQQVSDHLGRQDTQAAGISQTVKDRINHTDEKFDSVEKKLDRGTARMDGIDEKLDAVSHSLAKIEGATSERDKTLERIEKRLYEK